MTQRIFDIENEKDMTDLWDILPNEVQKIEASCGDVVLVYNNTFRFSIDNIFSINFHDKTEITRPIQEATEADIGKICCFGDTRPNKKIVGLLGCIDSESIYNKYMMRGGTWFEHCRRMTKQEIEELC